jgi:hypothetical protein
MRFLTPEGRAGWSVGGAAAGVVSAGPAAAVEVRIDGGPDGAMSWHARLVPGAPPRYQAGGLDDGGGSSYEQRWEDAVAQLEGRFDPAVAFMQGNLKARGATRPLYELFRLWASPAHRSVWKQLASATDR